jgi:phosphate transport system protein
MLTTGSRVHFNQELLRLQEDVLQLGALARTAVVRAMRALMNGDAELAGEVVAEDSRINDLRLEVESECYALLAMEQPVASDMRRIVSLMTISNDLERIGDHAKKIAKIVVLIMGHPGAIPQPRLSRGTVLGALPWGDVQRMSDMGLTMLDRALHSLVTNDVEEARAVCACDDEVDALYKQMFSIALTYMLESPRAIAPGTYQIQVGHELERVADRATNIAERLIYAATGELLDLNV